MENKIQELTEKIYREGVEKGNQEAQRLVEQAKEEASKIVEEAKKEAESIAATLRKETDELRENTQKELRLFACQAVNALKSEIANVLTDKLSLEAVGKFTSDKDNLNEFIVSLATKWSANEPIVISTSEARTLTEYFMAHAKTLLNKGVTIEQVNGIKTFCVISPSDGSYKVKFGQEEFMSYFKSFLRPQLVEMLF